MHEFQNEHDVADLHRQIREEDEVESSELESRSERTSILGSGDDSSDNTSSLQFLQSSPESETYPYKGKVVVQGAALRKKPKKEDGVAPIRDMDMGDKVDVVDHVGGWLKVVWNERVGYISSELVAHDTDAESELLDQPQTLQQTTDPSVVPEKTKFVCFTKDIMISADVTEISTNYDAKTKKYKVYKASLTSYFTGLGAKKGDVIYGVYPGSELFAMVAGRADDLWKKYLTQHKKIAAQPDNQDPVQAGPETTQAGMPWPFLIGNAAHISIASEYALANFPDKVYANYFPVSTILTEYGKTKGTVGNYLLRPDIVNIPKKHLYEIKPYASEAIALAEALAYQKLFADAGVSMQLGPGLAPGTSGILPAPRGYFTFWSPQAGVIVYMYNVGNYDPKKEPKANPQPVPGYSPVYSPYYSPKPVDPTPVIVAGSAITIWVILEYLGWGLLILI